jgi:8-oxo-dGTP pyrophosphatase MutT (NUDIX family)
VTEIGHELIPAATVVLLRDGDHGIETLMLRRNRSLAFAGGMWVWPGGRIDPRDHAGDPGRTSSAGDGLEAAARRAAVRETHEEAGLVVEERTLVWFSHWTPPEISPKRFATYFFAAPAPDGSITVDGGEIHEHRWLGPAETMALRNAGELELSPPTWITLEHLNSFTNTDEALVAMRRAEPEHFATRLTTVEGGAVALYHGDAGYESGDPDASGNRHRLWMLTGGWRYERDERASARV